MSSSLKLSFLLSSFVALPSIAFAAGDADIQETLVVTGTRTPVALSESLSAVAVFTAEDIQHLQVVDLPDLLQRVSGVSVVNSGGRGSVSSLLVRGVASNQTVVLIDGVRTASATTGASALSRIPLSSIERVEVVKGPLSSLYGADAMGGVIQVFTKRGEQGLGGGASLTWGNYQTKMQSADLHYGNGGFSAIVGLHKEVQSGFDRTDDTINQDDDEYSEVSGNLSVQYVTESLVVQGAYLRNEAETEFDNLYGPDSNHYSDTLFENLSLSASYSLDDLITLKFMAGYFIDDSENPAYQSRIKTQRDMTGSQADIAVSEALLLTVGSDYYLDKVSGVTGVDGAGGYSQYEESSRKNVGGFVQLQHTSEWIHSVVSARYDDNEAYGDSTTGNIAIEIPVGDNFSVVHSYGVAFDAPTFNELYWPNYGNPDLLPEESESFEILFKGQFKYINATLSVFNTTVENQIEDSAQGIVKNIDAAEHKGLEFGVEWNYQDWLVSANVSSVESTNLESNLTLNDRPTLYGNVNATWQAEQNIGLVLSLRGEHGRMDSYYSSEQGSVVLPLAGFVTADLGLRYTPVSNVMLRWQVNNLLNKEYVTNIATEFVNYREYGVNGTFNVELSF